MAWGPEDLPGRGSYSKPTGSATLGLPGKRTEPWEQTPPVGGRKVHTRPGGPAAPVGATPAWSLAWASRCGPPLSTHPLAGSSTPTVVSGCPQSPPLPTHSTACLHPHSSHSVQQIPKSSGPGRVLDRGQYFPGPWLPTEKPSLMGCCPPTPSPSGSAKLLVM